MMYNVPEQETKDIEERNTQEFQCVDDFITKGIKIHTGFLGPHTINKNGAAMLDFIDKHNLILLNGHAECLGEIT